MEPINRIREAINSVFPKKSPLRSEIEKLYVLLREHEAVVQQCLDTEGGKCLIDTLRLRQAALKNMTFPLCSDPKKNEREISRLKWMEETYAEILVIMESYVLTHPKIIKKINELETLEKTVELSQ